MANGKSLDRVRTGPSNEYKPTVNHMDRLDRIAHVVAQLQQYGGQKRMTSTSTLILCPYHSERTPSGRIHHGAETRVPGIFKCYGCGEVVTWDDLAPRLGLQGFQRVPPKIEYHRNGLMDVATSDEEFVQAELQLSALPRNKTWRSIPTNLLISIGAKRGVEIYDGYKPGTPFLYLPCYIREELRGYIKARFKPHEKYSSYINAKGTWVKTHGLFPFDKAMDIMRNNNWSTVILVEGQRDALRLVSMGLPALAILGTNNWSQMKLNLLSVAGVQRVVLMMDGDLAGIKATKMVGQACSNMLETKIVKLWRLSGHYPKIVTKKQAIKAGVELWDPFNCPQSVLDKVRKLLV